MKTNKIKKEILIDFIALSLIALVFFTLNKFTQEPNALENQTEDISIISEP